MSTFKVGDKLVLVGSKKIENLSTDIRYNSSYKWNRYQGEIGEVIATDETVSTLSFPNGETLEVDTQDESLEHEHIYNSPLYQALR